MGAAAVKIWTVALAFMWAFSSPVAAQSFDKPRGSGGGCTHGDTPPHSPVATAKGLGITQAFYVGPTTEYRHGVLGDAIEAKSFLVRYEKDGHQFCDGVSAGANRVFEDTSPRIVDLDADGLAEIIVVASHQQSGARLEVYGYPGPGKDIALLAHTPYIGRSHRWLAPIGAADLDGDGHVEVAYIDRPHLAKTLRVWRYRAGALEPVADAAGFTNHGIGEVDIAGGIRNCGGRPELIVATANWARVVAIQLQQGKFTGQDLGPHRGRGSFTQAMAC